MRLLILGGTVFLGRALTDAALTAGHAVTHVNRGRSRGTDPRVETIVHDRTLQPFLGGTAHAKTWDAVIDTSGYLPQVVRLSAEALRDRVDRYVFVSSISVYRSFGTPGFDEDAPVLAPPDPPPEAMTPELYGALKSGCEDVVREVHGERALIVRPGLIVGPHDPTDRFTWWPHRASLGGRFAAPGRPARPIQLIDVRDLAEWTIAMVEANARGVFNATGPASTLTMGELIEASIAASRNGASAEWIGEDFLTGQGVKPWSEVPLWLPEADPDHVGFMAANIARAVSRGLAFRPLARTVADTLEWSRTARGEHPWKAGLAADRETALLEAWDRNRSAAVGSSRR
jgi:2'-hydroxyisoflavone reductase